MLTVKDPVKNRFNLSTVAETSASAGKILLPAGRDGSLPLVSQIRWFSQTIELTSRQLFGKSVTLDAEKQKGLKRIIERLFTCEAVESVELDRDQDLMVIRLAATYLTSASVLEQISQVLCGSSSDGNPLQTAVLWEDAPSDSFQVVREGDLLTFWQVQKSTPHELVISNPVLKTNPELCQLTEMLADDLPGVSSSKIHRKSGTLTLRGSKDLASNRHQIIHALEVLSSDRDQLALVRKYPRTSYTLPIMTLAVASASQWWLPVLSPLAGIMVTIVNWRMIVRSFRDLRRGQLGLPMLTTLIVAGTAIGGAYFASALMSVLARYWQNQYALMLQQARGTWLGHLALPTGSVQVSLPDGSTVTQPVNKMKPDEIIEVQTGQMIPADGEVLSGSGVVKQWYGFESVENGNRQGRIAVHAGGELISGQIKVRVLRTGSKTRISQIRNEILENSGIYKSDSALNLTGQRFASKTVLPTLALAGFGLATGGVGTAVAVMRPDYATGVGLGEGLEHLRLASEAYREGFLIRDPEIFSKVRSVDIWISESSDSQIPSMSGQIVAELISPQQLDLVHGKERLTLQGFDPVVNDVDRMRLIQLLRSQGLKVGWSGNGLKYPNTARFADISLSTSDELNPALNPTAIVSLNPGPVEWDKVFEIYRDQKRENDRVRKLALIPNVAAVAGAFTLGFTSLASVILTNAGIWTVFTRTRRKAGSLRKSRHV